MTSENRIKLILKMQFAIKLFENAYFSGDQVSLDCAELAIEDCMEKLGIKNENKIETNQKGYSAVQRGRGRRAA